MEVTASRSSRFRSARTLGLDRPRRRRGTLTETPPSTERWWARGFRRLLATRLVSQCGDGLFQAGVAWLVLLSPDAQPSPQAFVGVLALVLLPFSVVGPFAGVLLDRWSRRNILVRGQLVRCVVVAAIALVALPTGPPEWIAYALVLVAIGINRVLLAGLSASLPHVVPRHKLVTANALAPTAGTMATGVGIGIGALALTVFGDQPSVVLVLAVAVYAGAAALAAQFAVPALGPDETGSGSDPGRGSVFTATLAAIASGSAHLRERRPAANALVRIGAFRFFFGGWTLWAFVAAFEEDRTSGFDTISAAALAAGGTALGYGLAALLTPFVVRRMDLSSWVAALMVVGALAVVATAAFDGAWPLAIQGFVFGLAGQTLKIQTDTLVQRHVGEGFLGRTFTLYDVTFNVLFVAGAFAMLAA